MHVHGELNEYRKNTKAKSALSRRYSLFGIGGKTSNVSNHYYKQMESRFYSENAKALEEAKQEREQIREKKRINNAKIANGLGMKWANLQEHKCPVCSLDLEDNEKSLMICIKHPGKDFIISKDKLKKLNEKHSKKEETEESV